MTSMDRMETTDNMENTDNMDIATSFPSFHDLLMTLPSERQQTSIQLHLAQGVGGQNASLCTHCDLHYESAWFEQKKGICFFCMRFRTPRITRFALLRETEWFFIQSGESDARAFYETYFYYLHRWTDRFCFPYTQEEVEYQEELRRSLPSEDV